MLRSTLSILLLSCMAASAAVKEYWLYKSTNLLVEDSIRDLQTLLPRAKAAGVTHLLLSDSKFSRLHEMDPRYFNNAAKVRAAAKEAGIAIVPAVFSIGYSNDLLGKNPNLAEAMPVRDVPLVVKNGKAHVEPATVSLKGGDMSDLSQWGWKDETVTAKDGAAYVKDPGGMNARITQKVKVQPWRQYHLSVRVKTQNFSGTPEAKFMDAAGRWLCYDFLKVEKTQDWTEHHVVFNSQEGTEALLYLGCWDGKTGELWWDDAKLEEVAFVNLVRREGAPLLIMANGKPLTEGRDFEPLADPLMGSKPYNGVFTVWHEPPVLKTKLPDGTRLTASFHHAATVHDGQACICPSEPATVLQLRDQAQRVNALWQPAAFMMSHDEIRVWNQCAACRARGLSAGGLLADNARTCVNILREVNPKARLYVWSDMFDPHHNAHDHYYLARGDFAKSWEGLPKEVTIVQWNSDKRAESLEFFADRGHRQVIAGYYDSAPGGIREWIQAAEPYEGVEAIMYTTWENNFRDMEEFFHIVRGRQ